MRRVLLFMLGFATLAASTEASPFTLLSIEFDHGGYVGDEAGTFLTPLVPYDGTLGRIQSPTGSHEFSELFESAVVEVRSGPLLNMTSIPPAGPGQFPATIYEYDGGTVSLEATWLMNGSPRSGKFVAPILDFTLTVRDEGIVDNCADVCVHTEDTLSVGPGLFDANLARYLGVSRHSAASEMTWYLELIDGSPGDSIRFGNFNPSNLGILVEAPEPGLALLTLLGAAGAALRRRRR